MLLSVLRFAVALIAMVAQGGMWLVGEDVYYFACDLHVASDRDRVYDLAFQRQLYLVDDWRIDLFTP